MRDDTGDGWNRPTNSQPLFLRGAFGSVQGLGFRVWGVRFRV